MISASTGTIATLCVLACALLLSACEVRYDQATDVAADGSGVLTIGFAVDEELRDLVETQTGDTIDFTDPESWEQAGSVTANLPDDLVYDIEPVVEEGYEGFMLEIPFTSPSQLVGWANDANQPGVGFPVVTVSDRMYRVDYQFDFGQLTGNQTGDLPIDPAAFFDVTFRARVPGEIVETNGVIADDGEVVWDLNLTDQDETLFGEGSVYALFVESETARGGLPPAAYGVAAVAAIALLAVVLTGRRKA